MATQETFLDKYLTPIAVILAGLIIAFALMYGNGLSGRNDGTPEAAAVDVNNINVERDPFIGQADAPNTMVVFYDYQCPFCKQFEQLVTPKLMEFVNNGQLKIVYRDFQFLGSDSLDAAVFGRALWEAQPAKFHEWYVAMYERQDDEGDQGFGDMASIEQLSGTLGIDVARVRALIAEKRSQYESEIVASRTEGASIGINGTPSVVIGKQLLTGMSPEQFYTAVVAEINAN